MGLTRLSPLFDEADMFGQILTNFFLKSIGLKRITAFILMWLTARYPELAGPELNDLVQYLAAAIFGIGQAQSMGIIPEKGNSK